MIVYLSLSIVAVLSFFSSNRKGAGIIIMGLILILIISLRYNVGYDYRQYVKIFSVYPLHDRHVQRLEWFNIFVIKLLRYFSLENFGVFIYSITSYFLLIRSFKGVKLFMNVLLIWLGIPLFFFASLSTLRQFLSVGVVFFIISRIEYGLFWRLVLSFLCIGLHQSGVLIFLILFLEWLKLSLKKTLLLGLVIVTVLPYLIVQASVVLGLDHLIDGRFGTISGGYLQFWLIFVISIPLLLENVSKEKYDNNNIFWIGLALYFVMLPYGLISSRVFLVFSFYFINLLVKSKYYARLYPRLFLSSVLLASFYYALYLGKLQDVNPYLPFNLIF